MQNTIKCPCCQAQIYFDLTLLLQGESFECSSCHSRISLSLKSRPIVAQAQARLEELKRQAAKGEEYPKNCKEVQE